MNRTWLVLPILMLASCSPVLDDATSAQQSMTADEPPFYSIDRRASSPLTMSELDINMPQELAAMYTESMRTCFFAAIEDLAASAGGPETLDPANVSFLPTDGTWQELTKYHRRNLLAQAIVSKAGVLCT